MCKKCQKNIKYWLHIADDWTPEERDEMQKYLIEKIIIETSRVYINI